MAFSVFDSPLRSTVRHKFPAERHFTRPDRDGSPRMASMNRRHDIDALRALAFAFLILFHIGMLYIAGWDWHIKSRYTTPALDLPMIFLNRWRMDLIFLVSG